MIPALITYLSLNVAVLAALVTHYIHESRSHA